MNIVNDVSVCLDTIIPILSVRGDGNRGVNNVVWRLKSVDPPNKEHSDTIKDYLNKF